MARKESTLSIFIDESGDFGELKEKPAYYLVTLVFHDQSKDISDNVKRLEESIKNSGFDIEYIHSAPIIRREDVFKNYTLDERRSLIYKILNFTTSLPIVHATVAINRNTAENKIKLSGRISREITKIFQKYSDFFNKFERLILYYDGGQSELSAILSAVFSAHLDNVEFRKAEPQNYRLLQTADFICTVELLKIKRDENRLSKSETGFFYKPQELKKTFIKAIDKKNIDKLK